MIVGFTGTRRGMTQAQKSVLYLELYKLKEWKTFLHGDCIGADAEAHSLVRAFRKIKIVTFPGCNAKGEGLWTAHCRADEVRPPRPYLERNLDIVSESDFMIAAPVDFCQKQRSGTWATIRMARRQDRPLVIIYPDGTVVKERVEEECQTSTQTK